MKIRNGFVSNSSSSSFIVKLDKDIKDYTFEEFYNKLKEGYISGSEYSGASKEDMAQLLFEDLNKAKKQDSITEYNYINGELIEENVEIKEKEFEYAVEYEDDCNLGCDMEHYFMPYLNITKRRISHH